MGVTFTLHVDAELWRSSMKAVHDEIDDIFGASQAGSALVPMITGTHYGLDSARLANEASTLGVDTLVVDDPYEVASVAEVFPGEILVQQPWDPRDTVAQRAWDTIDEPLVPRVIRTIASTDALHRLAQDLKRPTPVVIRGLTSTAGAGLGEPELHALLADDVIRSALVTGHLDIRGLSLDLPIEQPSEPPVSTIGGSQHSGGLPAGASNRVREAWGWAVIWIRALANAEQAHIPLTTAATTVWLGGLDTDEMRDFHRALSMLPTKVVLGDALWWSTPDALVAYGTVLAVHKVTRGREVGRYQRRVPKDGFVVVVSGGTGNGVGVQPLPGASWRDRAGAAANSARASIGRSPSPFYWAGKDRKFLETPSSAVSQLWVSESDVHEALAAGYRTPAVGDRWACRPGVHGYRYDRVLGLD